MQYYIHCTRVYFSCRMQQGSTIKQSGPSSLTVSASSHSCGGNPVPRRGRTTSPHHTLDGRFKQAKHTEQNEITPTASPVGQGLRTYPTGNASKGVKTGFTG